VPVYLQHVVDLVLCRGLSGRAAMLVGPCTFSLNAFQVHRHRCLSPSRCQSHCCLSLLALSEYVRAVFAFVVLFVLLHCVGCCCT
jgi:hypothetical protein